MKANNNRLIVIINAIAMLTCLVCSNKGFARKSFYQSHNYKPDGLHQTAIILKAFQTHVASGNPLDQYRLIANKNGKATIIPFQIDEVAAYEDYVLSSGPKPNTSLSNGIFDKLDELSFMATDAGEAEIPTKWNFKKPDELFQIEAKIKNVTYGSVFLAVYKVKKNRPKLSSRRYVSFDIKNSAVTTKNYKYHFDPNNYLVVKGIDVVREDGLLKRIVNNSSFYLKLDLKYFLTLNIGHSDIVSNLEAYKIGPIRTIVRVSFAYSFLKMNFEMGMYTEVSFFSNSVILPAIMYNPLDGSKSLNRGSGFYYGFATSFNTEKLDVKSNLSPYKESSILDFLKKRDKVEDMYTLNLGTEDFLMFMEISPSWKMKNTGNTPFIYKEDGPADSISKRNWETPLPLGKAPVNLGIFFDLGNFAEGEHRMSFRLFFENRNSEKISNSYNNLEKWYYITSTVEQF